VSDLNLATLRTWAARRDCPHPFLLQRKENTLLIGTKPNAMFRVQIPMQMEDEMPEIEVPTIKEMPGGRGATGGVETSSEPAVPLPSVELRSPSVAFLCSRTRNQRRFCSRFLTAAAH